MIHGGINLVFIIIFLLGQGGAAETLPDPAPRYSKPTRGLPFAQLQAEINNTRKQASREPMGQARIPPRTIEVQDVSPPPHVQQQPSAPAPNR